jgi:hypothetical protein
LLLHESCLACLNLGTARLAATAYQKEGCKHAY